MRTRCSWLAGTLLLFAIAATAQEKRSFDIPAQDASKGIQAWSRQSGMQVFASDTDLQGIRTNAVHGEYSVLDAARRLIEGTGLEVVSTGDKTVTIRRPPAGALDRKAQEKQEEDLEEVVVTGTRIARAGFDTLQAAMVDDSKQIEQRGYTNAAQMLNDTPGFVVNSGQSPIGTTQGPFSAAQSFVDLFGLGPQRTLTLVDGQRFVSSATAAGSGSGAPPGGEVDLNAIPVSLIERIETIAIGGAPVYGADAIAGTVNIILKDHFQGLEGDLQYGDSERGGTQSYSATGLFGTNFAHDQGNFVLSAEYQKQDGMVLGQRTGEYYALPNSNPPPGEIVASNIVLSGMTEGGLPFNPARLGSIGSNGAYITSNGSPTGTPLQFGPGRALVPFVPGPNLLGAGEPNAYNNGGDGVSAAQHSSLLSPSERTLLNSFAHFDFESGVRAFIEASYSHTEGTKLSDLAAFASPIYNTGYLTYSVSNPYLSAATRNTLQANGVPGEFLVFRNFSDLLQADGNLGTTTVDVYRVVTGLKGDFEAFSEKMSWDFSLNYGHSRNDSVTEYINDANLQNAVNAVTNSAGNIVCASGGSCVPINLFGVNSFSKAAAAYVLEQGQALSVNSQRVATADLGGHLPFGIGGAEHIAFNVGAEYRKEAASFEPNAVLTAGQTVLGSAEAAPYVATAGSFDTKEIYTEMVTPLVSDAQNFTGIKALSVEGAARYVDNSINGGATTWSMGGRFAPRLSGWGDGLMFRGVYTHSIRAPAITELFSGAVPVNSGITDPCDASLYNQGPDPAVRAANCTKALAALGYSSPASFHSTTAAVSVLGTNSGNPLLQNEQANSWSAGFVYQPAEAPRFHAAMDWSDIKLKDAIEPVDINSLLEACYDSTDYPNSPICHQFSRLNGSQAGPGTSNPARVAGDIANGYTSGYANLASIEMTGLIASAEYSFDVRDMVSAWQNGGSLHFGSKLFFRDKYIVLDDPTQPIVNDVGQVGFPRYAGQFNLGYDRQRLYFLLQALWTSAVRNNVTYDNTVLSDHFNDIGNYWKFNGTVGFKFSDHVKAQLVVNNLFDRRLTDAELYSANYATYDLFGRSYLFRISGSF
jgi:iron complex outermembrane recepter protein